MAIHALVGFSIDMRLGGEVVGDGTNIGCGHEILPLVISSMGPRLKEMKPSIYSTFA
jgi:hypothetical protein